ncbi:MAG: lipid-A-disaccharide synthase [Bacteroidetes bacterium]|nr:MAG: lipid-A-disaccharide synthase [Bacteroidota bacterium]
MKYYIISGEKSGDLHASNLIRALQKHDSKAEFRCWGGEEIEKLGIPLVKHYKETAFMGFTAVIANLPKILGFIRFCKKDLLIFKPDVLILIDYAGFNLRIAEFAKKKGFKIFYYISPKVWAWNQDRAKNIKRIIDKMFVIMPFEKDFYKKYDYEVDYIGNPIFDAINQFKINPNFLINNQLSQKPIIALLAGSRQMEIENMLIKMLAVAEYFPDYQFVVAGISSLPTHYYKLLEKFENIKIVFDQTYDLLSVSKAALVTSGTATLETALFNVPQVVCYKTGALQFFLGKLFLKIKFISLVNLIADKEVVKELLQNALTINNLRKELELVLGQNRQKVLQDYALLRQKTETPKSASAMAADLMWRYLQK